MTQHEARTGDKTMHGESREVDDGGPYNGIDIRGMVDALIQCAFDDGESGVEEYSERVRECRDDLLRAIATTPEAERPTPLRELVRKWRDEATKMRMLAKVALERGDLCGADESSDCASELDSRADELEAALSLPAAQDGGNPYDDFFKHEFRALERAVTALGVALHFRDDGGFARAELPTPNAIRGDKGTEAVAWQYRVVFDDVEGDGVVVDWTFCGERQARDFATLPHHQVRALAVIAPTQAAAKDTP